MRDRCAAGIGFYHALIIPVGLALLMVSLTGFSQQDALEEEEAVISSGQYSFYQDQLLKLIASTKSMGLLTKLALKKDYDQLLKKTRAHHDGPTEQSLEELRERYDAMLHRIVILLQEKDEELVSFIHDAREKWWEILTDEQKLEKMLSKDS